MLTPWKKRYDQPRQHLKNRDVTLLTKVCLVKAMVFPAVIYECESWTIKKVEHQRIDAFELWCWRRLLKVLPVNVQGWSPSEWTGWIQGTLMSLLQHHISKASILQHSAFFTVQLLHPYMTTGKIIALTRQTLVSKVMSLVRIYYLGWSYLFFQGVSIF